MAPSNSVNLKRKHMRKVNIRGLKQYLAHKALSLHFDPGSNILSHFRIWEAACPAAGFQKECYDSFISFYHLSPYLFFLICSLATKEVPTEEGKNATTQLENLINVNNFGLGLVVSLTHCICTLLGTGSASRTV